MRQWKSANHRKVAHRKLQESVSLNQSGTGQHTPNVFMTLMGVEAVDNRECLETTTSKIILVRHSVQSRRVCVTESEEASQCTK